MHLIKFILKITICLSRPLYTGTQCHHAGWSTVHYAYAYVKRTLLAIRSNNALTKRIASTTIYFISTRGQEYFIVDDSKLITSPYNYKVILTKKVPYNMH